jgi:tRNA(Ile2) C34 agmatinyltransferase TiaS
MIKHKKGFERLRVALTGLREYRCRDCDTRFRGPDRRRVARDGKLAANVIPRQI